MTLFNDFFSSRSVHRHSQIYNSDFIKNIFICAPNEGLGGLEQYLMAEFSFLGELTLYYIVKQMSSEFEYSIIFIFCGETNTKS